MDKSCLSAFVKLRDRRKADHFDGRDDYDLTLEVYELRKRVEGKMGWIKRAPDTDRYVNFLPQLDVIVGQPDCQAGRRRTRSCALDSTPTHPCSLTRPARFSEGYAELVAAVFFASIPFHHHAPLTRCIH